jgi:putative transcriptional regulator
MAKKLSYKSDAFEAIHTSASALYRAGAIDERRMREFDASCLVVPPIAPEQIKKSTVEKWETGAKKPSGMALKLLSLVEKHGLEILA